MIKLQKSNQMTSLIVTVDSDCQQIHSTIKLQKSNQMTFLIVTINEYLQ